MLTVTVTFIHCLIMFCVLLLHLFLSSVLAQYARQQPSGYGASQPNSYAVGPQTPTGQQSSMVMTNCGSPRGGAQSSSGYGGGGNSNGYGGPVGAPSAMCMLAGAESSVFTSQGNCAIGCALPFARRVTMTCNECMTACMARMTPGDKYQCLAAVYDYMFMTCDLYAVRGDPGTYPYVMYPNRDVFVVNQGATPPPGSITTTAPGQAPGPGTTPVPTPAPTPAPPGVTTTTASPGVVTTTPVPACNPGYEVRYLGVRDATIAGPGETLGGVSLVECAQACSTDQGGTFECNSFNYGPGQSCQLSGGAIAPAGDGVLTPTPGGGYFEKTCVASSLVQNCGPIFERYPNQILVGFAQTALPATTLDDCLNACLMQTDFKCVSGQYFPPTGEPGDENCVLNVETKDTDPNLFTLTDEATDYFEVQCTRRRLQTRVGARRRLLPDFEDEENDIFAGVFGGFRARELKAVKSSVLFGDWTSWNTCNLEHLTRKRYRRCETLDIRKCPQQIERCPLHDLPLTRDANEPQKPLAPVRFHQLQVTNSTTPNPPSRSMPLEVRRSDGVTLNKCVCMKNQRGRQRCDVGIRYVMKNEKLEKEYCFANIELSET